MALEKQITMARTLCEEGAWPELLKFAQAWHETDPEEAKALFYRGVALASLGRFPEAEASYRLALVKDPKDFKIWNNLAGILFDAMDRPMDAARCMEQALKVEPQNKLGWSNLASMAGRMGHHQKALTFAEKAIAIDPTLVEAHLHRATAAKALGKTEIVREACQHLAAVEPQQFRRAR
jgi:tetratricopeptide (TPR) repeat protein